MSETPQTGLGSEFAVAPPEPGSAENAIVNATAEVGHADVGGDLSTPPDDEQREPGVEPWTEDDDAGGSAADGDSSGA